MPENQILKGKEANIFEVGVVVKDLDKTVEYLTSLGLGPFRIRDSKHPSAIIRGKKAFYRVRVAMSNQGPVQLQLIEYQEGEKIFADFLEERGEGFYHLAFKVNNLETTLEKFSQKGIDILRQDRFVGGGGLAYTEKTKIGGIIIKLIQHPPGYDPQAGVKYE